MEAATPEVTGPLTASGRWSRITTLAVMGATAAIILTVAVLVNQPAATADGATSVILTGEATGAAPIVGGLAPDFQGVTVDGRTVRLSDLRGQPVWLTFGASWCQACRSENVDIQAAYERWNDEGLVVLAIFISEDPTAVADYASRVGLTYLPVADPDTRIASGYRILGIPSHYFIDRMGVLRQVKIGTLDPAAMDALLSEIQRWSGAGGVGPSGACVRRPDAPRTTGVDASAAAGSSTELPLSGRTALSSPLMAGPC